MYVSKRNPCGNLLVVDEKLIADWHQLTTGFASQDRHHCQLELTSDKKVINCIKLDHARILDLSGRLQCCKAARVVFGFGGFGSKLNV